MIINFFIGIRNTSSCAVNVCLIEPTNQILETLNNKMRLVKLKRIMEKQPNVKSEFKINRTDKINFIMYILKQNFTISYI